MRMPGVHKLVGPKGFGRRAFACEANRPETIVSPRIPDPMGREDTRFPVARHGQSFSPKTDPQRGHFTRPTTLKGLGLS